MKTPKPNSSNVQNKKKMTMATMTTKAAIDQTSSSVVAADAVASTSTAAPTLMLPKNPICVSQKQQLKYGNYPKSHGKDKIKRLFVTKKQKRQNDNSSEEPSKKRRRVSKSNNDSNSENSDMENNVEMVDCAEEKKKKMATAKKHQPVESNESQEYTIERTSDDDDDEEEDRAMEKNDEEVIKRTSNRKVAVVVIKSAVIFIDMENERAKRPKEITLSHRLLKRTDKITRRPIRLKGKAIQLPHVQFVGEEFNRTNDDDICYLDSLDLVSLRSIAKNRGLDIKLAPSKIGDVLKDVSLNYLNDCKYVHRVTNNTQIDIGVYHLLYGAVPKKMANAASVFMAFCYQEFQQATSHLKPEEREKLVCMYAGDLELMCLIYWQLSTRDLIRWKNNVRRKDIKQVLAAAWSSLPEGKIKDNICALAEFEDNDFISNSCLLYIKANYSDMLTNNDGIKKWKLFMRLCGIHHFACAYTLVEVHKRLRAMRDMLLVKYEHITAQNREYVSLILSSNEIYKLFKPNGWLTSKAQVTQSLKNTVNNLLYWVIRMFALHLIFFGIYPFFPNISYGHVAAFVNRNESLIFKNVPDMCSTFSDRVVEKIYKQLFNILRLECDNDDKVQTKNIEQSAITLFLYFARKVIETAMYRSIYNKEPGAQNFVNAINGYLNKFSVQWGHSDAWIITNDIDTYDGTRKLIKRFEDLKNSDDFVELKSLTSLSVGEHEMKKKLLSKNKVVNMMPETLKYPIYKKPISRTKCVLCFNTSTTKAVVIEADTTVVAACPYCVRSINTDALVDVQALIRRIHKRYQPPVGFNIVNDVRVFIKEDELKDVSTKRVSYNIIDKEKAQRKKKEKTTTPKKNG
ncbi:hypothetical protein ANTPLA_LOCUS8687 [Anthophora plagiata]